jgi:hypothetical protein
MSSVGTVLPAEIEHWLQEEKSIKTVGEGKEIREAIENRQIDRTNRGANAVCVLSCLSLIFLFIDSFIHID